MSDNPEDYGLTKNFWGRAKKMGLTSPAQLMWLAPKGYLDFTAPRKSLQGLRVDSNVYVRVMVTRRPRVADNGKFLSFEVTDGQVMADVMVFGRLNDYMALNTQSVINLYGKVGLWNGRFQIKSPRLVEEYERGKILPEYLPGESGLSPVTLAKNIKKMLALHEERAVKGMEDWLSEPGDSVFRRLDLGYKGFSHLLRDIHSPKSVEDGRKAISALGLVAAYGSVKLGLMSSAPKKNPAAVIPIAPEDIDGLISQVPFPLTGDQARATREIASDLARQVPMRRLLSGDVGSGKTMSYLLPAVAAQQVGRQVVVIMPNALLARQVAGELEELFPNVPQYVMCSGDKPPSDLSSRPVILGTTAVLFWAKELPKQLRVDLLIIDEQQKMGMNHKRALIGPTTHVLEATATATPRSQALAEFGISNVSHIKEMPVQKTIDSFFMGPDSADRIIEKMDKTLSDGHQVAIVYPLRAEGEDAEPSDMPRSVEEGFEYWNARYPGKVAWVHGGLKAAEKRELIRSITNNEYQLVVCSVVIEVGLTIPGLRMLWVVDADRHGASGLHQLRGRLARRGGHGLFYLSSSMPKAQLQPKTRDRLEMVANTSSGHRIAQESLKARGFGELKASGVEQSGFLGGYIPGIKVTPGMVDKVVDIFNKNNRSLGRLAARPAPF